MDQLINSLPAVMRAAGDAEEVALAAAQAAWNHVAGEALRQQTLPTSLQKQRLYVAVSDSVWRHQLEEMSGQLVFRLNSLLGQGTIRFIEFRVEARVVEQARFKRGAHELSTADGVNLQPVSLELVSAAASIHDPDLRRAFLAAAGSSLRRRESTSKPD